MARSFPLAADPELDHAPASDFADALSALASGVVLVTCRVGGRPWGMTATAFASVSATPPTVLVSLGTNARTTAAITRTQRFGVSILAAEQISVAQFGSASGASKVLDGLLRLGDVDSPAPALVGALAHLDCGVSQAVPAGDHVVVFGRVLVARRTRDGLPLVYHRRSYQTLAGHPIDPR